MLTALAEYLLHSVVNSTRLTTFNRSIHDFVDDYGYYNGKLVSPYKLLQKNQEPADFALRFLYILNTDVEHVREYELKLATTYDLLLLLNNIMTSMRKLHEFRGKTKKEFEKHYAIAVHSLVPLLDISTNLFNNFMVYTFGSATELREEIKGNITIAISLLSVFPRNTFVELSKWLEDVNIVLNESFMPQYPVVFINPKPKTIETTCNYTKLAPLLTIYILDKHYMGVRSFADKMLNPVSLVNTVPSFFTLELRTLEVFYNKACFDFNSVIGEIWMYVPAHFLAYEALWFFLATKVHNAYLTVTSTGTSNIRELLESVKKVMTNDTYTSQTNLDLSDILTLVDNPSPKGRWKTALQEAWTNTANAISKLEKDIDKYFNKADAIIKVQLKDALLELLLNYNRSPVAILADKWLIHIKQIDLLDLSKNRALDKIKQLQNVKLQDNKLNFIETSKVVDCFTNTRMSAQWISVLEEAKDLSARTSSLYSTYHVPRYK